MILLCRLPCLTGLGIAVRVERWGVYKVFPTVIGSALFREDVAYFVGFESSTERGRV